MAVGIQDIDERFDTFGSALNDVQREAVLATSAFEHNHPDVLARVTGKKQAREDEFSFVNTRLVARDLGAGQDPSHMIVMSDSTAFDDAVIALVRDFFNSELRWLLVNAYEAYENFIEDLYALLGCLDADSWKQKHRVYFNGCTHSGSEYERRRVVVRNSIANHGIKPLLNRFRCILPDFKKHEAFVHKGLSLRDWMTVIAQFRHRIVHCRGKVDEPEFWSDLAESLGRPSRANVLKSSLSGFVDFVDGERGIWLLDRRLLKSGEYSSLWLRLRDLIQIIAEHGCLVYRNIVKHYNNVEPVWIRDPDFRIDTGRSGPSGQRARRLAKGDGKGRD